MFDLAEYALGEAQKLGVEYGEVRMVSTTENSIIMKNGIVECAVFSEDVGIGVRALFNGGLGFASTNIMKKGGVKEAAENAVKCAKNASNLRRDPIILYGSAKAHEEKYEVKAGKKFIDLSVDQKMDYLNGIERSISKIGVKVPNRILGYGDEIEEKLFINSEGSKIWSTIPRVSVDYMITVLEDGHVQQANRSFGFTGGLEMIDGAGIEGMVSAEAKALQRSIKEGKLAPEEKIDVVIGQEVSGIAVHESVGHPYEADRIQGREAAQAGESFIKPEMLGNRIGSEMVNVLDDPTLKNGYGFYMYDDEGVKARPKSLIKEGVINEFLQNRETAGYLDPDLSSNGSARAVNYDREPIIRMSNTYLAPGDHSFEELIEGVKLGVYIKSFTEWNIDDRRYHQRYVGRESYLIENGEIKDPVKDPVLEITTPGLWMSVDAVGREDEYYPGNCGKGDPMQGIPVWMGGAPARLRGISLRRKV